MKQKFISLALAVMLLLGVTGCAMSTPASVMKTYSASKIKKTVK